MLVKSILVSLNGYEGDTSVIGDTLLGYIRVTIDTPPKYVLQSAYKFHNTNRPVVLPGDMNAVVSGTFQDLVAALVLLPVEDTDHSTCNHPLVQLKNCRVPRQQMISRTLHRTKNYAESMGHASNYVFH